MLGKSLGGGIVPFAGIVARDEHNVLQHRSIGHYTHEKNPLCSAVGLAEIEFIEQHELVEQAAWLGEYLQQNLEELGNEFDLVGHVAGKGIHIGIDLVKDRVTKERATVERDKVVEACFARGLLVLGAGKNAIRLSPPLVLSKDQATTAVDIIDQALGTL